MNFDKNDHYSKFITSHRESFIDRWHETEELKKKDVIVDRVTTRKFAPTLWSLERYDKDDDDHDEDEDYHNEYDSDMLRGRFGLTLVGQQDYQR